MTALDWIIVAVSLLALFGLGLWVSRRGTGSMADFFVAGRSLPWWLAGTSMLATSFASDTPLHVTRMIREHGLSGAWFYWSGILYGVAVAFFFARLWRRTGVVTDPEMIELRYSGRPAAVLRVSAAFFRGVVLEIITLSWVILGMTKMIAVLVDLPETFVVAGFEARSDVAVVIVLITIALSYSVTSGLWGVVVTDLVEFGVAMLGAIVLAYIAVDRVGGPRGLVEGLAEHHDGTTLDFLPSLDGAAVPAIAIGVYFGVQWWSTPYIDGSGQRAQRFLSCKNEGNALLSGVWNMLVQWVFRSWPWYLTALASILLYPDLVDHETAYPRMIADLMPAGLRALMVASFFAAFMSTVDSLLNLCGGYLSNDVYRRFVKRDASERHYLVVSRIILVSLAVIAGVLALLMPSVLSAFRLKMELMAGLGLVTILRWFWWRVNGLTELVTLATSMFTAVLLRLDPELGASGTGPSATRILIICGVSGAVTLLTASFTKPEPRARLVAFYERVRPPAWLWGPVALEATEGRSSIGLDTLGQYVVCLAMIFCAMFGLGKLLLGMFVPAFVLLAVAAAAAAVLWKWVLADAAR
ncbi:MAG: sodium:solute symporter family protein [Deltaproteobacteria bacterium]